MPLAAGKSAFKAIMKTQLMVMSANQDQNKTPEQAMDEYLEVLANACIALIKNATVSPTTMGAPTLISASPGSPVTGVGELL